MAEGFEDLIVRCGDPKALDTLLGQLPMVAAQVVDGTWDPTESTCTVRVFGSSGFLRFAFKQQGYGEILGVAGG